MSQLHGVPVSGTGHPGPRTNLSFEQERREVLESVMEALCSAVPDSDEMAACSSLLKHLAATLGSRAASAESANSAW